MTPAPFSAWEEDRDSDSDSDVDEVEYMLETYFMQVGAMDIDVSRS